jgi:hypothetical protein
VADIGLRGGFVARLNEEQSPGSEAAQSVAVGFLLHWPNIVAGAKPDVTASLDKLHLRRRGFVTAFRSSMSRGEYFAALCILGCVNGIGSRAIQSIASYGLVEATFSTFDVSALVWIAAVIAIRLLLEDRGDHITTIDMAVGGVFLVLVALPIAAASWFGLTALGLHLVSVAGAATSRRRGAKILIAITIPMLWSRLLFRFFSEFILQIDASLVGRTLGTATAGNVVRFADGSGDLVILPACSSLAGLSLVVLCWVTVSQAVQHPWSMKDVVWCALAGASAVAVNIARVSIMGLSGAHYEMLHSAWGNFATNTMTLCLVAGFCMLGAKRELFARV